MQSLILQLIFNGLRRKFKKDAVTVLLEYIVFSDVDANHRQTQLGQSTGVHGFLTYKGPTLSLRSDPRELALKRCFARRAQQVQNSASLKLGTQE